jgi:hypothetical protein
MLQRSIEIKIRDKINKFQFENLFIIEFLSMQKHFYFKSIFLKSSFDIAGWPGDGAFVSLVAAFCTDAGTKEILDFCSGRAVIGFRGAELNPCLPWLGLSLVVGGAEMATVRTLSMNSVWSVFMTATEADLASSYSM